MDMSLNVFFLAISCMRMNFVDVSVLDDICISFCKTLLICICAGRQVPELLLLFVMVGVCELGVWVECVSWGKGVGKIIFFSIFIQM